VQREILTHRKADRFFIIDDEETRQRFLSRRLVDSRQPDLPQLA